METETPRIVLVVTRASNQPVVQAIARVKVLAIAPAAVAPEHARVVAQQVLQVGEPETAQVMAGPQRDPVVAEPELVRAVGVLQDRARNRRRVRAEEAAELTASVTAVYQPVPVTVRTGGAVLAAEAAALLARAVAAAVTAWAVAASAEAAVAAAVVMAAAAGEAAEEAGDSGLSMRNKIMTPKTAYINSKIFLIVLAIGASGFPAAALRAAPETKQAASSQGKQKEFDTPQQAVDSLVQAAESFDVAALKEILGPDAEDIVSSEDAVQDKNRAMKFAARAKEKTQLGADPQRPNLTILTVGNDDFPTPIPIVKKKGKWLFDTKVGREEILNRRIGTNELDAITICRGFDDAQKEYAQEKHDDSKVNQYAQKCISTPGKHDGLAWKNPDGTWGGPVGEGVAEALEQGYTDKTKPYHGYYFKVLTKQGPAAPGGETDFVVGGAMIGGFGLVAAPAEYRVTGVKTFMAGPDGVVFEKDLGPDTLKTFQAMDSYNPDKKWKVTDDDWPEDEKGAEAEPTASP